MRRIPSTCKEYIGSIPCISGKIKITHTLKGLCCILKIIIQPVYTPNKLYYGGTGPGE